MMDILYSIISPIEFVLAWITYSFHYLFTTVLQMADGAGFAWILAIIFMTLMIRTFMLPLYFKQIRASSKMTELQPEIQAIQRKYKNKSDSASKEAMSKETMEVYSRNKANPMSSCFPALIQGPVLFALFTFLRTLGEVRSGAMDAIGPIDSILAANIQDSQMFGVKVSDTFSDVPDMNAKIVIGVYIAIMCITMFLTQFLMVHLNVTEAARNSQMYTTQKFMPFIFPVMYIFMGTSIPSGVLIYWMTSNLYMLIQQGYVLWNKPAIGSRAHEMKERRQEKWNVAHGLNPDGTDPDNMPVPEKKTQRAQPVGKARAKKKGAKSATPIVTITSANNADESNETNASTRQSTAEVNQENVDIELTNDENKIKTSAKLKEGDTIIVGGKKKIVKKIHRRKGK
ncbi:MAG: membrane protein insertase YidC [Bifidobacteriaceae bacterium]|jgi:YidC/Oxa1 family membrane protein insertase|nr:membrane protein insertase YidC [Bifidobacteriaceae bacterium]